MEEARRIDFVLELDAAVGDFRADRPAVFAVVAFAPPAVQDAQVEAAVGREFHAARARGFERTQRVVEPEIDALGEAASDERVVILDEDEAAFEPFVARPAVDFLDEALAAFVLRMGLARKDKLHGTLRVGEDALEAVHVREEQGAALVGGEPAGEPDGENLGVQEPVDAADALGGFPVALALGADALAGDFDQPALE